MPKPIKVRLTKIEFPDSPWEKPLLGQVGELVKLDPPVLFDYVVHVRFPDELWNKAFKGTIPHKPFRTIARWIEPLPGEPSIHDFANETYREQELERTMARLQRLAKRGLTARDMDRLDASEVRILIDHASAWSISKEQVEKLREYLPEPEGARYSKAHEHSIEVQECLTGPGR